jgi:hypothetical protein
MRKRAFGWYVMTLLAFTVACWARCCRLCTGWLLQSPQQRESRSPIGRVRVL